MIVHQSPEGSQSDAKSPHEIIELLFDGAGIFLIWGGS